MNSFGSYRAVAEIIEWMNQQLTPIEASVFSHYRGIIQLVRLVDKAEAGETHHYAALAAIRNYNEEHKTNITYEEIRDRSTTYIFAEIGEWAAYVDSPEAVNSIVLGDHDDAFQALVSADADISWIVLWLPRNDEIVVVRSPFVRDGVYILPPEVEASVGSMSREEVENWRA